VCFASSPLVFNSFPWAHALSVLAKGISKHRFDEISVGTFLNLPLPENYTRNEWRRRETTLETGGEDAKPHSKRVEKI
jgi:hypothetical protein